MRNRKRRRLIQQEPTPVTESAPTPAAPVVEDLAVPEKEVKPRKRKSLFSKD
tara:strand:- start:197 stop:352 length:156 start_codon:yes stop_codon:yes gene_type:complete